MQQEQRRSAFKKIFASLIGLTGISALAKANTESEKFTTISLLRMRFRSFQGQPLFADWFL
jgi:hypothetical protein